MDPAFPFRCERSLAPLIPPLLGPNTPVVFAVNGIPWWYFHRFGNHQWRRIERLDPDGALERAVGLERVIGCVISRTWWERATISSSATAS